MTMSLEMCWSVELSVSKDVHSRISSHMFGTCGYVYQHPVLDTSYQFNCCNCRLCEYNDFIVYCHLRVACAWGMLLETHQLSDYFSQAKLWIVWLWNIISNTLFQNVKNCPQRVLNDKFFWESMPLDFPIL